MKTLLRPLFVVLAVNSVLLSVAKANDDNWACEVVLCLSNPEGATAVAPCVPPMKKLWRELAKGNPFPKCNMGGDGNGAEHRSASVGFCPAGYIVRSEKKSGGSRCMFDGAVTVYIGGKPATRVWWNSERSMTELPGDTSEGDNDDRGDTGGGIRR